MSNKTKMAQVTCPKCQSKTELDVPTNACLPSYVCTNCQELITIPKSSKNCCVVCEYSEGTCPNPANK